MRCKYRVCVLNLDRIQPLGVTYRGLVMDMNGFHWLMEHLFGFHHRILEFFVMIEPDSLAAIRDHLRKICTKLRMLSSKILLLSC